ncbi:unnamed protein product [Mytilus coruscus]|uniref:Uncharacterized protein n=1 Tax=Mytilus coruscus TaxID=42192 RepID=A0A6J8BCF4_MYTCO|nr:unnamed protein product [Mytilus coruscus]
MFFPSQACKTVVHGHTTQIQKGFTSGRNDPQQDFSKRFAEEQFSVEYQNLTDKEHGEISFFLGLDDDYLAVVNKFTKKRCAVTEDHITGPSASHLLTFEKQRKTNKHASTIFRRGTKTRRCDTNKCVVADSLSGKPRDDQPTLSSYELNVYLPQTQPESIGYLDDEITPSKRVPCRLPTTMRSQEFKDFLNISFPALRNAEYDLAYATHNILYCLQG